MLYIEYAAELNKTDHVTLMKKKIIHTIFDHSIFGYHLTFAKNNTPNSKMAAADESLDRIA